MADEEHGARVRLDLPNQGLDVFEVPREGLDVSLCPARLTVPPEVDRGDRELSPEGGFDQFRVPVCVVAVAVNQDQRGALRGRSPAIADKLRPIFRLELQLFWARHRAAPAVRRNREDLNQSRGEGPAACPGSVTLGRAPTTARVP